ncbi:signal transduction histidine kinase [Alkaliphilus hydrothermalis]|uniref:histidine kinase n=1 Tax=Alkaliphilus hydrothermalis TaxID=1482730 RepID=A0ABS2NS90_9FIRM|nr:signal transduction histidine kinase [Alkaliphilus hydrothermalis]
MKNKAVTFLRLIVFLFTLPMVIGLEEGIMPSVITLLLLLALNTQLRRVFLKERAIGISLIIDLILIFVIHQSFGVSLFLPMFITAFDGVNNSEGHEYGFSILIGGMLYYLTREMDDQQIILSFFALLLALVFAFFYKGMSKKISELEEVYDDVRRYSYELEVAKNQISSYSQQVEHLTAIKERQRISEEIHDTIGHRLTALLMQMEAGVRLLDNDINTGKTFLKASVDNLRESIEVLRQTVRSTMPKEYKNLINSFEDMIRKFKRETGTNVELRVVGIIQKLYPGVEMVLYRNAQEAITNAVRHGKAKNIFISITYDKDWVKLVVKDDGKGCESIKKGIGISSMEERLKFVGGSLEILQTDGFVIKTVIPLESYNL